MIKRLYIDTSVFGGYFDQEFKVATGSFFHKIKSNKLTLLISSILELEIYQAPQKVIDLLESFPAEQVENIDLTDEVKALAEKYVIENVVGKSSIADCQHIALATIYRADVLAS